MAHIAPTFVFFDSSLDMIFLFRICQLKTRFVVLRLRPTARSNEQSNLFSVKQVQMSIVTLMNIHFNVSNWKKSTSSFFLFRQFRNEMKLIEEQVTFLLSDRSLGKTKQNQRWLSYSSDSEKQSNEIFLRTDFLTIRKSTWKSHWSNCSADVLLLLFCSINLLFSRSSSLELPRDS